MSSSSAGIKGTFGFDNAFLKSHYANLIELKNANASILIVPELQGRVMTSTSNGESGKSYGWINHDLIASGEKVKHVHPMGGEERFWLGPEGGQFSIYFKPNTPFDFEYWQVPKELDTESFEVTSVNENEAHFEKHMHLVNYSGTELNLKVDRSIKLLKAEEAESSLRFQLPKGLTMVGYQTTNKLSNTGKNNWDNASGKLSIWLLSMFNSTDETTIIIPFKPGNEEVLGKIVTDDYFGKVRANRLRIKKEVILYKADGNSRGKIGVSPQRALPFAGSYDATNNVLTITQFSLPATSDEYVNSLWEHQENPFKGDAVNAYNDGKLEDGSQLGPFYELESSSPALGLKSGEEATHTNQTFHFEGDKSVLNELVEHVFGISLTDLI